MDIKGTIIDAITESKCFLFFHSENSSKSNWALNELLFAIDYGKKVLPIMVDHTPLSGEMAFLLSHHNLFDLTDSDNLIKLADVAQMLVKD